MMKKRVIALLLCAMLVFAFAACGEQPVATVNGVEITQADYEGYVNYMTAYYSQMYSSYGMEFEMTDNMAESLMDESIQALVQMEEYVQACAEKECAPTEAEMQEYLWKAVGASDEATYNTNLAQITASYGMDKELTEKIILSGLYQEKLGDCLADEQKLTFSKKEAQALYDENPDTYNSRTVSHILVKPVAADEENAEVDENGNTVYTDEEWAAAKAKAEDLIKQLDDGADFAELAKENSDDTASAENGGALDGAFTKEASSYVEEFTAASFKLTEKGQYTAKPVKSTYGYHIILCTDLQDKDVNFKDLLKGIIEEKINEKKSEAVNTFIEKFDENADVVINFGSNKTDAAAEADAADDAEEAEATEE